MEVEEELPSFSAQRLRVKLRGRARAPAQRRLDYNAPLMSVRRLAEARGQGSSKVWKLSGELSKEPLHKPGAVPFDWEHSPGRPKQPVSPLKPASPSPPSTPSPPIFRRAYPSSPPLPPSPPPPPPLPPLILRSSGVLLPPPPPPPLPPPPPPPPPPPRPLIRNRPLPSPLSRRAALSPNPFSPPLPPQTHLLASAAHPFPSPFSSTTSLSPSLRPNGAISDPGQLPDNERIKGFRLVEPTEGFLQVLRARRHKLESQERMGETHDEDATEETSCARSVAKEMSETAPITEVCSNHESQSSDVPKPSLNDSNSVVDAIVRRFLADHPDPADATAERQLLTSKEVSSDAVNVLPSVGSNGDAELQDKEDANGNPYSIISLQGYSDQVVSFNCTNEAKKVESAVVCSTAPLEQGHQQAQSRKGNKRQHRRSRIAILDSCRVVALGMIRNAMAQVCRKAAEVSMRTLSKAKRKVTPSRSLDVVVHRGVQNLNEGSSDEEEAVVREVKAILQERLSRKTEQSPISIAQASISIAQSGSPPKAGFQCYAIAVADSSLQASPKEQAGVPTSPRPTSSRYVRATSTGRDDPNEFYDVSSRFGSQSSTPGRTSPSLEGRTSMLSKDWGSGEFLDATSTPVETPRASVSENKLVVSGSGSSSKSSKLSKRVGKALWVDTREVNAGREGTSTNDSKGFLSGELNAGNSGGHKKKNCSRKLLSEEQGASANSSTLESTIQHKEEYRNGSFSRLVKQSALDTMINCKRSVVSVPPVFPAKCQKNRLILIRGLLSHEAGSSADVGWPLGISGYHPESLLRSPKVLEKSYATRCVPGVDVPSPPLPPAPAGGSWLKKALSSNAFNKNPSRLAGLHMASPAKKKLGFSPTSKTPGKRWEDMVKGSHVQPGHLRFSEELYHYPSLDSNSNKYFIS